MKPASLWPQLSQCLLRRNTLRFAVLRLARRRAVASGVPISVCRHDGAGQGPEGDLLAIKGSDPGWSRRWSRGHVCYLARAGDVPVAFLWIGFDGWRVADNERARPLPPSAAFLYDAITTADWRGRNIYPALLSAAADDLARHGCDALYLLADDRNAAAHRAPEKVGFEFTPIVVRRYRILKLLRVSRCRGLGGRRSSPAAFGTGPSQPARGR